MSEIFNEIYANLIGKECCSIRIGFGSMLRIGIGEKVFYENPKLKGKFHGEWDIISRSCSWRIVKENKILCGDNDDIEECSNIVNKLTCGRVKDIFQTFEPDLTIQFDNNIHIEYFSNSLDDNQLIIMSRNKISYDLTVDGWIKENNDKHSQTLSQIDEFISKYSEECNKRWEKVIPECNNLECDSCFYFRQIDGHFYFWDYGICSNGESPYDTKLVGIKSGCEFHKTLKDIKYE